MSTDLQQLLSAQTCVSLCMTLLDLIRPTEDMAQRYLKQWHISDQRNSKPVIFDIKFSHKGSISISVTPLPKYFVWWPCNSLKDWHFTNMSLATELARLSSYAKRSLFILLIICFSEISSSLKTISCISLPWSDIYSTRLHENILNYVSFILRHIFCTKYKWL